MFLYRFIISQICIRPGDLRSCTLLSPQEYEEKLAKLQAKYHAEQESKAKLQEDIAVLCSSYESKLSDLENARASRGSSVLKDATRKSSNQTRETG